MPAAVEIVANVLTAISILLAARNSVHTWWTGIAGCVAFGVVFFEARLYADVALQIFFVVTSIYGWRHWAVGAHGAAKPITRCARSTLATAVLAGGLAGAAYGFALRQFTNAAAPFVDSAVLAFSVIAQLLLMGRRLETWWFWLAVNTLAVPLFASRGLWMTAMLYAAYWINAWYGLHRWKRTMRAA